MAHQLMNIALRRMIALIQKHCSSIGVYINLTDYERETLEFSNLGDVTLHRVLGCHYVISVKGESILVTSDVEDILNWFKTMALIVPMPAPLQGKLQ